MQSEINSAIYVIYINNNGINIIGSIREVTFKMNEMKHSLAAEMKLITDCIS